MRVVLSNAGQLQDNTLPLHISLSYVAEAAISNCLVGKQSATSDISTGTFTKYSIAVDPTGLSWMTRIVTCKALRCAHLLVLAGGDLLQEVGGSFALGQLEAHCGEERYDVAPRPMVHNHAYTRMK